MKREEAYAILNMIDHVGPVTVRRLIQRFGSPEKILELPESDLRQVEGVGAKTAKAIGCWRNDIPWERELEKIEKSGLQLITQDDDEYPLHLREIHDPPLVLYLKGKLRDREKNSIAMVGMRHPTHYGQETARTLAYQFGSIGMSVVSGLAMGIDTWSHRGCLQAKGHTAAVLGFGFGYLTKSGNLKLAQEIVESGGAILTEFPYSRSPDRQTFPMRNRIVSGMTMGTLVVEAGLQSGALITAHFAVEQGRQVFSVPGRIDHPQSMGCHKLIQNGAKLTQCLEDVLEEFEYLLPKSSPGTDVPDQKNRITVQLTDTEEKVMSQLSLEEREIDEITAACDLPASIVSSTLMVLEMKRVAKQLPGKRYILQSHHP